MKKTIENLYKIFHGKDLVEISKSFRNRILKIFFSKFVRSSKDRLHIFKRSSKDRQIYPLRLVRDSKEEIDAFFIQNFNEDRAFFKSPCLVICAKSLDCRPHLMAK